MNNKIRLFISDIGPCRDVKWVSLYTRGGTSRPSFGRSGVRLAKNPAGRRLRPTRARFPNPAPGNGRYVGRLGWSRIRRPVRWPFAVEPDLAAVTLAVCVAAGSGGRYVGRFRLSRIRRPVRWPFCGGGGSGGRYVDGSQQS